MWLTGQALLQAFTMIQLETLDFGTTREAPMKQITATERGALFTPQVNEIRDSRCALIHGRVFDVTSVDKQHIFTVYDVSGYHYYNLSDESYQYPAEDVIECWVTEDENAAEAKFLEAIKTHLGE